MAASVTHRAGLVAIVGRPNTGKSTLLNCLVGQKISITSRRPQTTRHRVLGIVTRPDAQFVFVDTPGLQARYASRLNRAMNRTAIETLAGVDAFVAVVEALRFGRDDKRVLDQLPAGAPVVLAVNKVDRVDQPMRLLPFIDQVSHVYPFSAIVPASAKAGYQVEVLLDALRPLLPEGQRLYPETEVTDRSERFLAAELIREKLFRLLGEEVPYATEVQIESFERQAGLCRIHATVLVDKPGQKAIVIGEGGARLKQIATQARLDMESLFAGKGFLEVWVKVKSGWMDDATVLRRLGYD